MRLKQKKAVALRYRGDEDSAPRIVAKGEGTVADRIREVAQEAGVPLYEDDALVEVLAQIELDREVPPELYQAVAEVMTWVYRANNELR